MIRIDTKLTDRAAAACSAVLRHMDSLNSWSNCPQNVRASVQAMDTALLWSLSQTPENWAPAAGRTE